MIVTFKTKAYSNITMFGDVAKALLKMMGHSGTVPGALPPELVQDSLQRLETELEHLASAGDDAAADGDVDDDAEGERKVTLAQRAWPLRQLLQAAADAEEYVYWE